MKAISVKNPWAFLIFHGKDVENRTWPTNFRGTIAIHSSQRPEKGHVLNATQLSHLDHDVVKVLQKGSYPNGAIIGQVDITGCVQDSGSIWAVAGQYHWQLANSVMYPKPIPCKGKLNFWDVPDDAAKKIVCQYKMGNGDYGQLCPCCGWDLSDDCVYDNNILSTEPKEDRAGAFHFGISAKSWEELWKCPDCRTMFRHEAQNF